MNFELFYKENYNKFYCFVFQYISDREICLDMVNDAFEFAWKKRHSFNSNELRNYVYAYLRNKCIDHIRHSKVKERFVDFHKQTFNDITDDEYNTIEEEISEMQKHLLELPERTQFILEECFYKKKKYKEVADELNISVSAIKKHVANAFKILRHKMLKKP